MYAGLPVRESAEHKSYLYFRYAPPREIERFCVWRMIVRSDGDKRVKK